MRWCGGAVPQVFALIDLNLTLLLRTRNEEVEGIEPSFSLQGKLHERDAVYHVYLRPFATDVFLSRISPTGFLKVSG